MKRIQLTILLNCSLFNILEFSQLFPLINVKEIKTKTKMCVSVQGYTGRLLTIGNIDLLKAFTKMLACV